jgi:hypothetical protein
MTRDDFGNRDSPSSATPMTFSPLSNSDSSSSSSNQIILHNLTFIMTDMYNDGPKQFDGKLKPYPHEDHGFEVGSRFLLC